MLAALQQLRPAAFRPGASHPVTLADVEALEATLLARYGASEGNVHHHFAAGVYVRELVMPAGDLIVGAEHTGETLNIVLSGRARVVVTGQPMRIVRAGDIFVSPPGTRKVGIVEEEMRFLNVHANPDNIRDPEALRAVHTRSSAAFLRYQETRALAAQKTSS